MMTRRSSVLVLTLALLALAMSAAGAGAAAAAAEEPVDETQVHQPKTPEFTAFVNQHALSLVEFYAPWCGHCKHLRKPYAEAATALAALNIPLAKVDATVETKLQARFNVRGFPTLFVFRHGKHYAYHGGRTNATIVSYMQTMSEPSAEHIATDGDAAFLGSTSSDTFAHVVLVAAPDSAPAVTQPFWDAAHALRTWISFAHRAPKAGEAQGMVVHRSASLISKHETAVAVLPLTATTAEVLAAASPLVLRLSPRVNDMLRAVAEPRPMIALLVAEDTIKTTAFRDALNAMQDAAARIAASKASGRPQQQGKALRFAYGTTTDARALAKSFGALPSSGLLVVAHDEEAAAGLQKFVLDAAEASDINADAIASFARSASKGQLAPFVLSEAKPARATVDGLTTVVGSTFASVVLAPETDVFIELYSPNCGHCKNLEPIWGELATHFKKKRSVTIAKMDATANDAPAAFEARGFPTLLFAPAGAKTEKPIAFDGKRTLPELIAFVEKHSKTLRGGGKRGGGGSAAADSEL